MSQVPRKPTRGTFWALAVGTPAFLVAVLFETLGVWGSLVVAGVAVAAAVYWLRRGSNTEESGR
ncbi:MAG: hypothetical protein KC613_11320 [Myxococcales bacterium]|nr:hypothetical protein [Myxococcales bacterium]